MRILGADGLTGSNNSIDNIPSGYLDDGDICLAKHPDTSSSNDGKIYFYILKADQGGVENLPNVVVPLDNSTIPTDKRWVLAGIYQDELTALNIFTNTISQASSDTALVINDTISLSGDNVTFTNVSSPPFSVNSQFQVDNLNSEYWGGIHWTEFDIGALLKSGDQWVNQDVDTVTVFFPIPQFSTTYSLFTELHNETDPNPSLYTMMVTNKTTSGFTVKLSGKTDSPYYRVQWAILGDNSYYEVFNLQDAFENDIADVNGNLITVT